jgi:hypothetical protein
MPSPDGCFVQVWDDANFSGAFDYINGPRQYPSLRDMPGGRAWSRRIHSARTGPNTTATLFANENGRGAIMTLRADTEYPRLGSPLDGTAESMMISCSSPG